MASINNLEDVEEFQELRFGEDTAFEMSYYESNNGSDGWVKLMWKVFVKPKRDQIKVVIIVTGFRLHFTNQPSSVMDQLAGVKD